MNLKKLAMAFGVMTAMGCSANVKVEPVEVKPIKMTIDINIKVDRQLDQFFEFEDELQPGAGEAYDEGDRS